MRLKKHLNWTQTLFNDVLQQTMWMRCNLSECINIIDRMCRASRLLNQTVVTIKASGIRTRSIDV